MLGITSYDRKTKKVNEYLINEYLILSVPPLRLTQTSDEKTTFLEKVNLTRVYLTSIKV